MEGTPNGEDLRCRWENGLIRDPPLYPSFGPRNITVITSQKFHHQHAFLIRFPETHFPHSLKTETQLCHKMHPIPTILTVVHTSKSVQYCRRYDYNKDIYRIVNF